MSENNTQKIITDAIFKSAIEKILTEISDYIYVEEPYTKPEIDDMFDATSQEIDYYSSLINDGMISENRLWSAKKISEELAKCILESNAYTDGLLSNLSSIELKYVTSLPIDNISSNTIYILKSSVETEPVSVPVALISPRVGTFASVTEVTTTPALILPFDSGAIAAVYLPLVVLSPMYAEALSDASSAVTSTPIYLISPALNVALTACFDNL